MKMRSIMRSMMLVSIWIACLSHANAAVETPNLYDLTGQGLHVTYSDTSITGEAQLTYSDKNQTLNFRGEEIRELRTELGRLITVTIEQVPDLKTVTFSLLLPDINLQNPEEKFTTKAIITTHHTTIAGPDLVPGQLQSYQTVNLRGIASKVYYILPITGISGTVLLSPTCPGPITPGNDCIGPYAGADIVVLDLNNNLLARTTTDKAGMFNVIVPPGDYVVQIPSASVLPRCPDTPVSVPKTGYATIEIVCDTGLR